MVLPATRIIDPKRSGPIIRPTEKYAPVVAETAPSQGGTRENNPHTHQQQQQQKQQPRTTAAAMGTAAAAAASTNPLNRIHEAAKPPAFVRTPGYRQARASKRLVPVSSVALPLPAQEPASQPGADLSRSQSRQRTNRTTTSTAPAPSTARRAAGQPRTPPEPLIRPRTPEPRVKRTCEPHASSCLAPLQRCRPLVDHVLLNPGTYSW